MVKMAGEGLELPGQVVLVLQGGGALGAYQVGVFQALHEAGIEPDWVIGTSIGAINGAIIAGNPPDQRMPRLETFWNHVRNGGEFELPSLWPGLGHLLTNFATVTQGVPTFFTPRRPAWGGLNAPLGVDAASYYSTEPLRETLGALVDFAYMNAADKRTRLTVGAVNVRSGSMRYFDSRDEAICLEHVMASGALPPAFPAIRVESEPYWDGGIYSNTPLEAVLDDHPRKNSVIFMVNVWQQSGPEPESIWQVMGRQKDIQYASWRARCPRISAAPPSSASLPPGAAIRRCTSCGCSRRGWTARITPRTSTSPLRGSVRGATPATPRRGG